VKLIFGLSLFVFLVLISVVSLATRAASHCKAIYVVTGQPATVTIQDDDGYQISEVSSKINDNKVFIWHMKNIMQHSPTVYIDGHWVDGRECIN